MDYPRDTDNLKESTSYNGWKNYETWNVALWIGNDEGLYNIARTKQYYSDFADTMNSVGDKKTPDGVVYGDCINGYGNLDIEALDKLIKDLKD